MTCAGCENPASGTVHPDCRGCQIREIARGPQFFASAVSGRMTPAYRAQLVAVFGDGWKAGHDEVRAAAKTIDNGATRA